MWWWREPLDIRPTQPLLVLEPDVAGVGHEGLRAGPDYKAYSFTWDLPGEAQPVVINIPDCDWCQDKTIYSGKWAVVEQEGATVISAITLGTQTPRASSPTPPTCPMQ